MSKAKSKIQSNGNVVMHGVTFYPSLKGMTMDAFSKEMEGHKLNPNQMKEAFEMVNAPAESAKAAPAKL